MRWTRLVVVLAALLGSCAGGETGDIVLVSRHGFPDFTFVEVDPGQGAFNPAQTRGRLSAPGGSLRDADGDVAMLEASVRDELTEFRVIEDEEPCGLSGLKRVGAFFALPVANGEQPRSLRFGDESIVQLFWESSVGVESVACFVEVGSWVGSGSFEGRSGSYQYMINSLQIELVLTES